MDFFELNTNVFRMINDLGKQYDYLNPSAIFIAEYMVFLLALAVIVIWFTRNEQSRMMVVCGMITFVIAEMMGKMAGRLHSNNQPFAELANVNQLIEKAVDNSFPSDHTILFFSFCVSFWLFKKRMVVIMDHAGFPSWHFPYLGRCPLSGGCAGWSNTEHHFRIGGLPYCS